MWLLPPLLLLVVPVSSAPITGPEEAKGLEQGWLEVQCRYAPGWETYKKWWCRGADLSSCKILVKTNGSEQEAKGNRVSIRDDQSNRTFTVTMKALRRADTDLYWCGIERIGSDRGSRVNVIIGPGQAESSLFCVPSNYHCVDYHYCHHLYHHRVHSASHHGKPCRLPDCDQPPL
ncbi:CMRF35-like molecule 5 isoform X3 [Molossus molossus]|uniref:CMRF35-like molecule 5 isoform X3 n=1 Tax=Molossus molossus TaxID=27622 RepID=UPI00174614A1|nr:CMRF35-like molecule 5 isoform X3 [Molossus molossus]